MDDKNKAPAGVKIMGVVVVLVVICIFGIAYAAIRDGTKTGNFWDDLMGAKGPWTVIEKFYNEKIMGYTDEEMPGGDGEQGSESVDDRFD